MYVLISVDSAEDAELIVSQLREAGIEPIWERAGAETEYLAGLAKRPDIVVADYHLSRLDAARALRLMQEHGLNIPFIVIGGAIGEDKAVACLKQGASDFLLKDRLGGLAQAVTEALEAVRLRGEREKAEAARYEQENALRISEERFRLLAGELQVRVQELVAELSQREASLRDAVSQREAALQELQAANTSLEEAATRLKQLDRLKSEIVSTVSHELRTPLNNLKLYLDLLEAGNPEKRARYMATLHREVHLLESLIDDILQLSRLDLGHVSPILEPLDASRLLLRLADDRRELVRQRGLSLEACITLNLPPVMADARMLQEVLNNLLTNAMNYTPKGGTIRLQDEVQEQDRQLGLALSVSDTGLGISSEDLPHIFERYYRGEAGRQSRAPGTGLGLAICEEIVKRHHGQISVQSTVGEGSTFTVWLPALPPEEVGAFRETNPGGVL